MNGCDGLDLVAYAAGTAPVHDQSRVEDHLLRCPSCGRSIDQLRTTLLLLEIARLDDLT